VFSVDKSPLLLLEKQLPIQIRPSEKEGILHRGHREHRDKKIAG
jgi:hypothetical protein